MRWYKTIFITLLPDILPRKSFISAAEAKAKAEAEYDLFNPTQQIDSDFDKEIRSLLDID